MRRLLDVLERWETELFLLGVAGWVLPMLDDRLAVMAPLRWALVASLLPWLYRIARWSRQAGVGWTVRFVASQLIGLLSPFVWLFTLRQLIGEGQPDSAIVRVCRDRTTGDRVDGIACRSKASGPLPTGDLIRRRRILGRWSVNGTRSTWS